MRYAVALALGVMAIVTAIVLGARARRWNEELAVESPFAHVAMHGADPHTPRLTDRVVLVVIDGLGADAAQLPFLDELRTRGVSAIAAVPYPTVSRPNYITILTGVPPRDSGIRANRVLAPVAVDSVMNRVHAAGLHAVTASDYGSFASLFVRAFDDVRRVDTLAALAPVIAELAAGDAAFVAVLVLDVDRAGHAAGVGAEYRAAATAVDAMLRDALAHIDFTRDTVIVTADHGHVATGGHGGTEREVSFVPLVLAGNGIRGGVRSDARLIDVAPTVAALLGVPAPEHAEGRTLVELLALDPAAAARREAADTERTRTLAAIVDAARDSRPDVVRLVVALGGIAIAAALAVVLRRRRMLALSPVGVIAFVAMALAMVVMTRGHVSPSYVPTLPRVEWLGAIGAGIAVAAHVIASWLVVRRADDRVTAANGIAFVALAASLGCVALVRAWYSPPHVDVPPPVWMVAVPTLDLAAATCAVATVLVLAIGCARTRRDTH